MATNKVKVSTDTHTDTKTSVEDGVTVQTTTTKTIDKYSDGSTSTTTETHTVRHEDISGTTQARGGSNNSKYTREASPALKNAQTQMAQLQQPKGMLANKDVTLTTDEKFIQDVVFTHNNHRARHGVPPLTLSPNLCRLAQQWANAISQKGTMDHSGYGYGENIYWNSGSVSEGAIPVEYWYSEMKAFNWDHNDFEKGTGALTVHPSGLFTQVIWKNSQEIGVAKAHSQKGTFVVALYNPAGNVIGDFPANVFKPVF